MTQRQEKITTIPVDDLITGWVTKDGEVEKVEIDGYSTFSSKDIAAFEKELIEVNQTLHYQALHKAVFSLSFSLSFSLLFF